MKVFSRFAIIFLLVLAGACAKKTAPTTVTNKPVPATVTANPAPSVSNSNNTELVSAKALYASKCGRCHELHQPSEYNHKDWDGILQTMFVKAQMVDTAQQRLIRLYVFSGS